MKHTIACNLASYGRYRDTAYVHLAEIGLSHVEIPCPERSDTARVSKELSDYGLAASSLIVPCQLDADDVVIRFTHTLEAVAEMGVKTVFTSVKTGELDLDYVYGRLQSIGDAAARHGVTVVLETHPDLVTNARIALDTMSGVAHPNVRVNFDTANVYYYNEGVDVVEELRQVARYVAAVHLKDTNGGFKTWHFPALGDGVVDFPSLFEVLEAVSYQGPLTLEIEGIEGETLTEEIARTRVEQSLAYLDRLGLTGGE
jgi:sugar phosphate isomerase/epimerase